MGLVPALLIDPLVMGVHGAGDHECRQNEHERWMRFYALFNWRWGPEKSSEHRTHPALLPYDQLPDGEREKDDSAWLQLFSLGAQEEDTP